MIAISGELHRTKADAHAALVRSSVGAAELIRSANKASLLAQRHAAGDA
jgi:hypothetical protein